MQNKNILWVIAIAIVAVGLIVAIQHGRKSGLQSAAEIPTSQTYASNLWDSLATGDVSSTECGNIVTKYYSDQNPADPLLEDYFYSYTKHRCIGAVLDFPIQKQGSKTISNVSIDDLATNQALVWCRFVIENFTRQEGEGIMQRAVYDVRSSTDCSDQQGNSWTYEVPSINSQAFLATSTMSTDGPDGIGPLIDELKKLALKGAQ
jgi:hypothetical protein